MISNPSLMSHEDRREYNKLVRGLMEAHNPRNEFESMVIQRLADANWEIRRVQATDSEYWEHLGGCYSRGNTGVAEALLQEKETRFRALFKMRALAQRQYEKAMDELYRMLDLRERTAQRDLPAGEDKPVAARAKTAKAAAAGRPFEANTTAPVIKIVPKPAAIPSTG